MPAAIYFLPTGVEVNAEVHLEKDLFIIRQEVKYRWRQHWVVGEVKLFITDIKPYMT